METNSSIADFIAWPKTPRLFRQIIVTEKIDGSNGQVAVHPIDELEAAGLTAGNDFAAICNLNLGVRAGSRTQWINPRKDNFGFAQWVLDHAAELATLGVGRHFGEWWGQGIQRNYGLTERRFSLFNVSRWEEGALSPVTFIKGVEQPRTLLSPRPACCGLVPVIYSGVFDELNIEFCMSELRRRGSFAAPGFKNAEGIVVFHTAANRTFKVLLENDENPKGE